MAGAGLTGRETRLALALLAMVCFSSVAASKDRELEVLAKALKAKKAAVHHLSSTLQNKIRPEAHASAAHTAASHKSLQAAAHSSPLHVTAQALKEAPAKDEEKKAVAKKTGGSTEEDADSLLKESIDDNKVGDFSKDGNKHDKRMMKGKFDWLLKASSPLYAAAKVVANKAEHQVVKVLHKTPTASGSALQEDDSNATSADEGGAGDSDADADLEKVKRQSAKDEAQFLEFSQDKEGYYFAVWMVALVVVLGVLGLCVVYARQCLGAPEGKQVPAGAKPGAFSGGGYGTGGAR